MAARIRLEDSREQARLLEDAILAAKQRYSSADQQSLSAYLSSLIEELSNVRARIDAELGIEKVRDDAASLWVRLRGGRVGEGRAPAHAVGKVIEAIQKGTRQAAAFIESGTAVLHYVPKEIRNEASLDILAFAPGSARIAVAPSIPQLRVDKPYPLADMGLRQLVRVAHWAQSDESDEELDGIISDPTARRQTLSRIRDIAPSGQGDYTELQFSGLVVGQLLPSDTVLVTPRAYRHASDFLERRLEEAVTLGGRLVAIDVEKPRFHLRYKRSRIRCDFTRNLLDTAKSMIDTFVEVAGTGLFRRAAELPHRIEVTRLRRLAPEEIVRLR